MRKYLLLFCVLLLFQCLVFSSCISVRIYDKYLKSIAPAKELQELKADSHKEIAFCTYNATFHYNEIEIDIEKAIQKAVQNTCEIDRILFYTDNAVWLTFREYVETGINHCIAKFHMDSNDCEIKTRILDKHKTNEIREQFEKRFSRTDLWNTHAIDWESMSYEMRSSFYSNGKIIISNYFTVYEYIISTGSCSSQSYEEYEFPKLAVIGYVDKEETELHFSTENETKVLTVDDAEKTNKAFSKLLYSQRKIVESTLNIALKEDGYLTSPFRKIISTCDQTYVMCQVYNTAGCGYCVVFSYDFASNSIDFVDYIWCHYAHHCQVVPLIKNDTLV